MSLPRRQLLLKRAPHNPQRPGPIVTSPEEDRILSQQWFSRLSVPRSLSGSETIEKDFLRRGFFNFVNGCLGLLYFVDSGLGAGVVWNPSTDEERYLPPPGANVLRTPEVGYTYCLTSCFGYDPQSRHFKVLSYYTHVYQTIEEDGIAYDDIGGPCGEQYLLYSTQNNRWVDFPCPDDELCQLHSGCVYLNECGFWVGFDGEIVVSFSFSDENFISFPLAIPTLKNVIDDYGYGVIMVEVDEENTLGFVVYRKSHFEFWTCVINSGRMPEKNDDDGSAWNKRWEFSVDFPEECGKVRPLLVYKNGDELLMFMVNSKDQLMVYGSSAKELKLLPLFSYPRALDLISYHETSVTPNFY